MTCAIFTKFLAFVGIVMVRYWQVTLEGFAQGITELWFHLLKHISQIFNTPAAKLYIRCKYVLDKQKWYGPPTITVPTLMGLGLRPVQATKNSMFFNGKVRTVHTLIFKSLGRFFVFFLGSVTLCTDGVKFSINSSMPIFTPSMGRASWASKTRSFTQLWNINAPHGCNHLAVYIIAQNAQYMRAASCWISY